MAIEHREISEKLLLNMLDGYHEIEGMKIPILKRELSNTDKLGQVKVRLGVGRYSYEIPAGLYILGDPAKANNVIVTCNYKLTIDYLRTNIKTEGLYILVLDTFGINVWCAAGKSTFGTKELVYQLTNWDVKKKLKVRRVILPQLGATSMEPHIIRKLTGLTVVYGPVDGKDLDKFIADGFKCDEDMRTVKFPLKDRLVLTPIEFIQTTKYWLISIIAIYLSGLLLVDGGISLYASVKASMLVLFANFIGTVIFPAALPLLPFKSFALKNILLSMPILLFISMSGIFGINNYGLAFSILLIIDMLLYISFIGFRFTGSTTFTSFSGVKYEGKILMNCLKVLGAINVIVIAINLISGGINA